MREVLRHLEADEAAADDQRAARRPLVDPAADARRCRGSCARRRCRAGRCRGAAAGSAPRRATAPARRSGSSRSARAARAPRDRARGSCGGRGRSRVTSWRVRTSMLKRSRKSSRRGDQQLPLVGDDVADEVRQAAVRERDVAGRGRRARSPRVSSRRRSRAAHDAPPATPPTIRTRLPIGYTSGGMFQHAACRRRTKLRLACAAIRLSSPGIRL